LEPTTGIQINKFISSSGFCSRREADVLVLQERVKIGRKTALPTSRVFPTDKVYVDDEIIKHNDKAGYYIVFNKPKGVTSTTDAKDKTNIISFINHNRRIFPIGRLDKDSEGLILLTDDGDIVNKILRSENQNEKEYVVTVDKLLTPDFLKKMAAGVEILETVTKPCKTYQLSAKKFKITLTQGLNRQIRRMCEAMGYDVKSLVRTRIMNIELGKLAVGKYRELLPSELKQLNERLLKSSNEQTEVSLVKKSKAAKYSKKTPNFKNPVDPYAPKKKVIKPMAKKLGRRQTRKD